MSKRYKILAPEETIVYKDDGKRIVLFLMDGEDETQSLIYKFYNTFVHEQLLDILLTLDYTNKTKTQVYERIHDAVKESIDIGPASEICDHLLNTLYLADSRTGQVIFSHNIKAPHEIIQWQTTSTEKQASPTSRTRYNKKWLYIAGAVALGILLGLLIAFIPGWLSDSSLRKVAQTKSDSSVDGRKTNMHKINAVYDPKSCVIYLSDSPFENVEYYIDYQKKVKSIDDINWQLQSSTLNHQDTLYLKDNCTVYLRGEKDSQTSEIQVIDVSFYDFITELLVTQDPLIKSMLVTNSSSPFGNTIFIVDGIPQQVSYYQSSELRAYFKKGFKITSIKMANRNLNPTNKQYAKITKIIIQKQ